MGDLLVGWGVDPTAIVVLAAAYVVGYFLKGITGFAEAVPIIGIGSFFVGPLEFVGMLTIADLAGGWVACLKSGEPMRTPVFDKTIGWQNWRHGGYGACVGCGVAGCGNRHVCPHAVDYRLYRNVS